MPGIVHPIFPSHLGQANPFFRAYLYYRKRQNPKWGVCMRVEGEDAAMNLFGMPVGSRLLNQKIEESGRDAVACRSQSFRDGIVHPISDIREDSIASGICLTTNRYAGIRGNLLDRLVMVSIGEKLCLSGYGCHGRTE